MEMPPDSLEAGGVNELPVAAAVNECVSTEQTASSSLGTHRERSSNSNTAQDHQCRSYVSSSVTCWSNVSLPMLGVPLVFLINVSSFLNLSAVAFWTFADVNRI
jgi:hypothetical protein